MNSDDPISIIVVIFIYLFAALFIFLWGYVTTRLTFSMVAKHRYVVRTVVWFLIAWPLALGFYFIFLLGGGVIAIAVTAVWDAFKN